eukprot:9257140-Pyramimonas_sp.AAC.1
MQQVPPQKPMQQRAAGDPALPNGSLSFSQTPLKSHPLTFGASGGRALDIVWSACLSAFCCEA